jgi:preprotein translocase subunit SecA
VVKIVEKLLRAGEGRTLKRLQGLAAQVNAIEDDFVRLSDSELREETDRFRARLADGESLDHLLPEAFAAVRRRPSARSGSATSTSRWWAAPRSTWGTSRR